MNLFYDQIFYHEFLSFCRPQWAEFTEFSGHRNPVKPKGIVTT